jgi:2-O-methyltransferase
MRFRRRPRVTVSDELGLETLATALQAADEQELLFIEVGANDGSDTRRLLGAFPSMTIECFEPDARAIRLWRRTVRDDRARLHECAIGATDGVTSFFMSSGAPQGREHEFPEGWHLSGSIRRPTGHLGTYPWCEFPTETEVTVRSLDSWSKEFGIGAVDFIWADVQGAERDLIEGGLKTLARTRFLYTEYSEAELYEGQRGLKELLEMLPGWSIHTQFSGDVLLQNDMMRGPS